MGRAQTIDKALDGAARAVATADRATAFEHLRKALDPAFADDRHREARPWLPRELGENQRRFLRLVVAATELPELDAILDDDDADDDVYPGLPLDVNETWERGLFNAPLAMSRIAGDERGPLDEEVTVHGQPVPMWFAIHETAAERLSLETLRAMFESVAPARRVEMIEDALSGPFDLDESWERRTPGDPTSFALENDFTSRFIGVLATLLSDARLVGIAHARAMAQEDQRASSRRGLVAAWVLGVEALANDEEPPEVIDRLVVVARKRLPTFYRAALRAVLRMLRPERRAVLLGDLRFYSYKSHVYPDGEVRRWRNESGWDLVDLLEPAPRVEAIVATWREWKRHRGAGNDREAVPLSGRLNVSVKLPGFVDENFPRDRAIDLLEACEPLGADALREVRGS